MGSGEALLAWPAGDVMLLPVLRFFALLLSISLMLSTGAAAAFTICQHQDAQAHQAARQSGDPKLASTAMAEEMAERSASKAGTVADQVQVPVGAFVAPTAEPLAFGPGHGPALFVPDPVLEPPSRPIAPPERPPHA